MNNNNLNLGDMTPIHRINEHSFEIGFKEENGIVVFEFQCGINYHIYYDFYHKVVIKTKAELLRDYIKWYDILIYIKDGKVNKLIKDYRRI